MKLFQRLFQNKERTQANTATSIVEAPLQAIVDKQAEVREQAWFQRRNSLAEMFFDEPPKQYVGGSYGDEPKLFYGKNDARNTYNPDAERIVEREIVFTDPETQEPIYLTEEYIVKGEGIKEIEDRGDDIEVYEETEQEKGLRKMFEDSIKNTANFTDYINKKDESK